MCWTQQDKSVPGSNRLGVQKYRIVQLQLNINITFGGKGQGIGHKTFPCRGHVENKKSVSWSVTEGDGEQKPQVHMRKPRPRKQSPGKAEATRIPPGPGGLHLGVCLLVRLLLLGGVLRTAFRFKNSLMKQPSSVTCQGYAFYSAVVLLISPTSQPPCRKDASRTCQVPEAAEMFSLQVSIHQMQSYQ